MRERISEIPITPKTSPGQSAAPVSADDLAKLGGMTREELIALVMRVGGAIWGYALADDTQKAEAARLKLYAMGMSATEIHKGVPALDKWFDRTVGRVKQQIELTGKDGEPLSIRLIEAQQRLLKNVTPPPLLLEQVTSSTNENHG